MPQSRVVLFGASGTLGYATFKELWRRRERYALTLLLRPSAKNQRLFAPYARQAGIALNADERVNEGEGFQIIWGDAGHYQDVEAAIRGAAYVLAALGCISPQADYHPELARAVNVDAIRHIVRAIEGEPAGAERIKLVYTGTMAVAGDRPPGIHRGRVGDPIAPAIFDHYAVTKVAGERAVLESGIRRWVCLRLAFIMPTAFAEFISLPDPILFHMPLARFMENITDRDAGFGLANCLDIPDDSDFWRRVYNMGGGPAMRLTAFEYLNQTLQLLGLSGLEACTERRWFALHNFPMQYYDDSAILDSYLHHWRDSTADFWEALRQSMPANMRIAAFLCRAAPALRRLAEWIAYRAFQRMAERHRNGTAYWYAQRNELRIRAFFGSRAGYEAIPDWRADKPTAAGEPISQRLSHGYDESKAQLELDDLRGAAAFRGGACLTAGWDGDLYTPVKWRCAAGHEFMTRPYTVLKAGHWCPDCAPPPWDYDAEARRNPFFAQVWYPNHDPDENDFYPAACIQDIVGAEEDCRR